jgi:hypothetical protein
MSNEIIEEAEEAWFEKKSDTSNFNGPAQIAMESTLDLRNIVGIVARRNRIMSNLNRLKGRNSLRIRR